jgi:hypothetical protein
MGVRSRVMRFATPAGMRYLTLLSGLCLLALSLSSMPGCNSAQADGTSPPPPVTSGPGPIGSQPTGTPTDQPSPAPIPTVTQAPVITNACTIVGWGNDGNPFQLYSCQVNGRTCLVLAGATTSLSCQ